MPISNLLSSQAHFHYAVDTIKRLSRQRKCSFEIIPTVIGVATGITLWFLEKGIKLICKAYHSRQLAEPLPSGFHLPTMDEVENRSSVRRLQAIWRQNNEFLEKIVKSNHFPRFGFHGTCLKGIEGIEETKRSEPEHLWVAGCDLQPASDSSSFCDLYASAQFASNYVDKKGSESSGGIFTIAFEEAEKVTKLNALASFELQSVDGDDEQDENLIDLEKAQASELHVPFTPATYSKVVKGKLLERKMEYSKVALEALLSRCQNARDLELWHRYFLSQRFRLQEIVHGAFQHLLQHN